MADDLILNETDRQKLDGIVQQMIANKENDADIQFVVNDFKSKYGQKKSPSVTTHASPAQSTKDSATVSGQQSESGGEVNLPKITLGEESLRGGVAKSDVIEKPKMEDAMLLEKQQRDQYKIDETARIKKDINKKLESANKAAKEQSAKASVVNYLQKLTNHFGGTVAQEGEPTEESASKFDAYIDIYEPIRLQTESLQPDMVSENVDPQLRERVVMKNSKLAKSATDEFNVAKPYIEGVTKLSQVKQKLGQAQAEYDAATNVVKEQRAAIDADLKRARMLNPEKMVELGFTEGFEKSLEQTTIANTIADMYMMGDDDKVKNSLESLYADSVLFPQEETAGGMIGGMIGGQVKPLAVGFGLGALNPALGVVGGSAYYGRMNMGSSMIEAYTTARAQGMDSDEAYQLATKQAKVGFATGAAEGLIGMVTMGGKPVQSAVTETFKRAVKSTLKEAGVDGAIAGGLKAVENVSMQKLGLDVETDSGVMQEMAAEALFGTAMHMAMFGGKKVLGANYGTIINGIASMPFNEIQAKVNEAVKAGVLDAAKGERFLTEVRVSSEAQEKLKGVDIPEKKRDTVIELQKEINQTEKDLENASPAVAPALEKKIEDLSAEMQVEAAIPLTAKEKTELNKLQTARDENKAYDKDRLKVLEKRQKAAEKVAQEKIEAEEKAKEETIKRQQEQKAAEEQAVEPKPEVTTTQVVETPAETVSEAVVEQPKSEVSTVSGEGVSGSALKDGGRKPIGDGKFVRYNPDDVLPLLPDYKPTNTVAVEDYVNETIPNDASVEAYKTVPIDAIKTSEKIENKDRAEIDKIKKGINNGDDIPPVVLDFSPVIKNGEQYQFGLMDGHHRYIAYKELGIKEIPAAIVTSREHYTFETNDTDVKSLFKAPTQYTEATPSKKESGGVSGSALKDVDFTAKGGNKIVDEKGEPITLLHGTNNDKIKFDEGTVFYATSDKQFADVYGENHLPVQISLKNPYDLTESADGVIKDRNGEPMLDSEGKPYSINYIDQSVVKDLKERGYDGVRMGNESVVAFDKSQVKAPTQYTEAATPKDDSAIQSGGEQKLPDQKEVPIEQKQEVSDDKLSRLPKNQPKSTWQQEQDAIDSDAALTNEQKQEKKVEVTAKALEGADKIEINKKQAILNAEKIDKGSGSHVKKMSLGELNELARDMISNEKYYQDKLQDAQGVYNLTVERIEELSEAYHKAKADGTNPELVKAVEELLGAPKATTPQAGSVVGGDNPALKDVESTANALEGVGVGKTSEIARLVSKNEIKIKSTNVKNVEILLNKKGNPKKGDILNIGGTEWEVNKINKRQIWDSDKKEFVDTDGYEIQIRNSKNGETYTLRTENNNPFKGEELSIREKLSNYEKQIAEAYHKAKADGSNPELVKAVEQSLKEQPNVSNEVSTKEGGGDNPALKDVESTAKALEGVDVDNKLLDFPNVSIKGIIALDENGNEVGDLGEIKDVGDNKIALFPNFDKGKGFGSSAYIEIAKKNPTKNVASGDMSPDAQKMWIKFYEKGFATRKQLGFFDNGEPEYSYVLKKYPEILSEAYHKAKQDGSNPELVKAVEDLLGKAPTQYTEVATPKANSVSVGGDKTFTTHKGEVVTGKKLTDAINKVADDMVKGANKKRQEYYASHITEKQKDEFLAKDLKYAEEVRQGEHLNNLTIAQRINYELTGESIPILPKEQSPKATEQVEQAAENETMVGKTVTFEHAGSEKSGVVKSIDAKGNLEVEGVGANKGVKYTVKKTDIVSETQEDVAVAKQEAQKENEELGKKINTVIQKAIKKQPTDAKKVIKNMVGFQQIADIPNRLFQNYVANKVRKYEDALAKALQKGSVSQNAAWRNIADFISSYSRGAMDTMEYSEAKRQKLTGGINKAKQDAEDLHGQMWDLIGGDVDSADRVHQVLDPDLRQTGLRYDDLTDAEKDLHDLLRSINEYTHNQNFLLGKISKETYDKYKGKYIGREYDFDKLYDQKIGGKTLREILGIYKQRQEVDAEKTLASIKDPIYLTLRRFMQTGQNMAVNEYAHWLYRNYRQGNSFGNAEMISNTERDGFIKLGQGFGALSDKWVARSIAEDFKGFQFTNDFMQLAYDLTKAYDGLPPRQFMKELLTVFNPQVQIGNITSNAVFSWLGGVDLPTYLSKAKEAYGEIKNRGQVYRDLQNEGLIGVDFVSTDLKPMQPQIGGQPENAFRKVERGVREFYQGVDDAAKIQLYLSLKDMGYTHREAVQTVFESLQNYQNTGRIWDLASKTPIVGNAFIKFTPEMLRLLKNGMTRRPLHTLALISLLSSMPKVLGKMFGNDDEEIDAAGRQKGIPKIMIPYTDLEIPLSWRLGDKRVNIARYLMPMYMYDVGGESKKATDLVNKFIPYQLKQTEEGGLTPVNVQDPFIAPLWGVITNKDFRDKPIVEETDDATDATIKRLRYGVRGYGGFYANLVDDIFSTAITGEDYYGRRKDALDVAMNVLIKIETFDDERLKQGIIMEFDGYERLAQKIYSGYTKKRKKLDSEIEEIEADKNMSKERKQELIAKKKAKLVDVSENVLEDIADIQEQQLKATEYYRNLSRKQPYKDIASEFRNTERAINRIEKRIDGKFKD